MAKTRESRGPGTEEALRAQEHSELRDPASGKRQGKAKVPGLVIRASTLEDAQEEWTPGTSGPRRCHRPPGE